VTIIPSPQAALQKSYVDSVRIIELGLSWDGSGCVAAFGANMLENVIRMKLELLPFGYAKPTELNQLS